MSKIIQLIEKPYNIPVAFEITGIKVRATSRDADSPATVNGVDVWETYTEIVYRLRELCTERR